MNRKDKDRLRALKREIKRSGNKKVRSQVKKDLATNSEDADLTQVDYGSRSSKKMNGIDYDATRKKKTRQDDEKLSTGEDLSDLNALLVQILNQED